MQNTIKKVYKILNKISPKTAETFVVVSYAVAMALINKFFSSETDSEFKEEFPEFTMPDKKYRWLFGIKEDEDDNSKRG